MNKDDLLEKMKTDNNKNLSLIVRIVFRIGAIVVIISDFLETPEKRNLTRAIIMSIIFLLSSYLPLLLNNFKLKQKITSRILMMEFTLLSMVTIFIFPKSMDLWSLSVIPIIVSIVVLDIFTIVYTSVLAIIISTFFYFFIQYGMIEFSDYFDRNVFIILTSICSIFVKKLYLNTIESNIEQLILLEKQNVENEKLSTVVKQSPTGVMITDTNGVIEYVNEKFLEIAGFTKDEIIGQKPSILKSGEHSDEYYNDMWTQILSGNIWYGTFHNKRKNGELYWDSSIIAPVTIKDNVINSIVSINQDVTEKVMMMDKLNESATIDEMTGIFNRQTGLSLLDELMTISKGKNKRLVISFADINDLKQVNDNNGHNFGDELIITVVNVIKLYIRDLDLFFRVGGDEFIIDLDDCDLSYANQIIDRIQNELNNIRNEGKKYYPISVSFGLVEYDHEKHLNMEDLIRMADDEMYENKKKYKQLNGLNVLR
ncbi:MAG: sensor domain-containing diguanylate cyclase [Clostridium sp.]